MAVTLDLSEYHMFCGGMDGSIFQVDLCAWVSDLGGANWALGTLGGCPARYVSQGVCLSALRWAPSLLQRRAHPFASTSRAQTPPALQGGEL